MLLGFSYVVTIYLVLDSVLVLLWTTFSDESTVEVNSIGWSK